MSSSNFADFLQRTRPRVEARLERILEDETARVEREAPELAAVVREVRSLTARGGKRLRAALVLLGYQVAARTEADEAVLPAAAAMELLQTYFLIHDDLMDDDPIRRGGPSVHVALRETYGALGDAGAILAGDYAVSLAQRVVLECALPAEQLLAGARRFAALQIDVVLGQCLDMLAEGAPGGLGRLVDRTHVWKTAAYTTTGPLLLGAALGGASEDLLERLRAYGDPLGIAFQLRDDWLGTFGDPGDTGKSNESDLKQGKKTAVLATLDEPAHADALGAFLAGGAGRARESGEIEAMQARLHETHASERVTEAVLAESERARAALAQLPLERRSAAWLEELIGLVAERSA